MRAWKSLRNGKMTAMQYVLTALIPYTDSNLKLVFNPSAFFRDLESTSSHSPKALKNAYHRAHKTGLIKTNHDTLEFSLKAKQIVQPFVAKKLVDAKLMIIFDIPEDHAHIRRSLRSVLVQFKFVQIQKSVWMTKYDHRDILSETVRELHAEKWVQLFEASAIPLSIKK